MNKVIGQNRAKDLLHQWWESQTIPHAILVKGKSGWGSLALAYSFIQYIFCTDKQGQNSCGSCENCIKTQKGIHPDVHFTFPAVRPKSNEKALSRHYLSEFRDFLQNHSYEDIWNWLQFINAENKQGNITADECRQIINQLNLTAYESGWKIQLIWKPEYLKENGNILLKIIEEPPAKTLIILVAESTEEILPTILSRVQLLPLQPLTVNEINNALKEDFPHSKEEDRIQVAQWAAGDYFLAKSLLQKGVSNYLDVVRQWFNGIFGNNQFLLIHEFVEETSNGGREYIKAILNYTQQLIGNLIKVKIAPEFAQQYINEEADFLMRFTKLPLNQDQLLQMQKRIADTVYYIERNVHAKTQLLALSLAIQAIYRQKK